MGGLFYFVKVLALAVLVLAYLSAILQALLQNFARLSTAEKDFPHWAQRTRRGLRIKERSRPGLLTVLAPRNKTAPK